MIITHTNDQPTNQPTNKQVNKQKNKKNKLCNKQTCIFIVLYQGNERKID